MSKTIRITKDPEIRRQEIIEAARVLFASRGIGKTSMAEIAESVGVAKGLVYYYFTSKEQLVEAIIDLFIARLDEALDLIVHQENLDFYAKLKAILNLYFNAIQSQPAVLSFSPADPGVFNLVRDRMSDRALTHAMILMQQGISQNLIRIQYPEYMLKILIRGLGDLYIEGVHQLHIHAALIEQTLGLENGRLDFN